MDEPKYMKHIQKAMDVTLEIPDSLKEDIPKRLSLVGIKTYSKKDYFQQKIGLIF